MRFKIYVLLALLISLQIKAQVPHNGQVVWLKAGSGYTLDAKKRVSTWKDASGNGFDAKQTVDSLRPLYVKNALNGFPVARFNGINSSLTCPNKFPVGTKGYTIVAVLQPHSFAGSYNTIVGGASTRLFWFAATDEPQAYHNPINLTTPSIVPQPTTYSSTALVVADTAKTAFIYQNGQLTVTGLNDTVPTTDSGIYVGSYAGYYWNFSGDIAEILIYNRPLTTAQMDSINNYISHKFRINVSQDSNVVLQQFPQYFQMYQRNTHDSAVIPVKGYAVVTGYDSVILKLYKNDTVLISRQVKSLVYKSGKAYFAFKPQIHAEETEYKVELHLKRGVKDTLVAMQFNLACGDIYIISGQSNTVVGDYQSMAFSNEYCRSFGNPWGYSLLYGTDTFWGYASGFNIDAYDVGGWGFRLQQYIHDSIHIPVAFIDGGVSGTSIEQNMKDTTNPTNVYTIYGRLLNRLRKAHLDSTAKALFWYQGESNSDAGYYNNFKTLYNNWNKDYPALEKIYVIQIKIGCFLGSHWKLREIERNFPDSFKRIRTMSVMATPGHDGCHYNEIGYNSIGLKMWRLVSRDFYHGKDTLHITAPDIERAFYRNAAGNSIGILFKDRDTSVRWTADTLIGSTTYNIKDAFYLDDSTGHVKQVLHHNDTLVLILDTAAGYRHLTYLPDHYYPKTTNYWEGPWLINGRGIGAFSFYGVPIATFSKPKANFKFAHLCYGDSTFFMDSSSVQYNKLISWKWVFGDKHISTQKNPTHIFPKDSTYYVKLIVTAELNRSDSIVRKVSIIPLPDAHFKWKVISATRVQFVPDDTTGTSYYWDFGDGSFTNRSKKTYTYSGSGKYAVTLTIHKDGCVNTYMDTVKVYDLMANYINAFASNVEAYPNPFSDRITINMAGHTTGAITIELVDITGKKMLNLSPNMDAKNLSEVVLNTASLPSGLYILQITSATSLINKEIVKVR